MVEEDYPHIENDRESEVDYDPISYKNVISASGLIKFGEYTVSSVGKEYISFKHNKVKGREELSHGWKIHISIFDSDENLVAAWDNIVPILHRFGVSLAKFIKPGLVKDKDCKPAEKGRQVTIYCSYHDDYTTERWIKLLSAIRLKLISLDIPPGYVNSVCRQFDGSGYFFYRNDIVIISIENINVLYDVEIKHLIKADVQRYELIKLALSAERYVSDVIGKLDNTKKEYYLGCVEIAEDVYDLDLDKDMWHNPGSWVDELCGVCFEKVPEPEKLYLHLDNHNEEQNQICCSLCIMC